jgi:hypothetical protein
MLTEQDRIKLEDLKRSNKALVAEQEKFLSKLDEIKASLNREVGYLIEAQKAAQDRANLVIEQKTKEIEHRKAQINKLPIRKADALKIKAEANAKIAQAAKVLDLDRFTTHCVKERKMTEAEALEIGTKVQKWQDSTKFEGTLLQAEAQMKADEETAAKKKKGGK